MDNETQARIGKYLEAYELVNPVVKNAEVTAAIIEQIGKDTRCQWLMTSDRSSGNGNGNGDAPATEKQIGFLKQLGVEAPAGCTKREASRLIDEAQANAA